jgi:signal transduction histidine kinase
LVVEDNPGDAELVAIRLRDTPGDAIELVTVGTLQEAIGELARTSPSAILLDLNLPDSSGLETVRALRAANERVPIVVLTGTDDLETGVTALREGADDYIAKPEIMREGLLRRALRYGIERRRILVELQLAVRAREELLQVVSHDLRNHANTIELGAQLLRSCKSGEDLSNRVSAIERASRTVRRLLEDLVDLAAFEKGVLVVRATEIDLVPLVVEAQASFLPGAEKRAVRLEIDVGEEPLRARADSVRITQILGNLVANAVRLTPSGGTVTLGARKCSDSVVLSVKDTGPGVPASDRSRLFDRFFRGSNPSGKGAGLGLAIARALVEAHGGRIWVESEYGQGATFFVSLPVAGAMAAGPPSVG